MVELMRREELLYKTMLSEVRGVPVYCTSGTSCQWVTCLFIVLVHREEL